MPKLVVDGFTVEVESDEFSEFYDHMKEKDLSVFEKNEWTETTKEKEKYYDSQEFLNDANIYFNASPPNLIQTSSKLWLASVYVVKEFYLQMEINPVSYRSLNFLMKLAACKCSGALAVHLNDSWTYAEQFHQYSYGSHNFKPNKFESRKTAVEFFVHNFPLIDKSIVCKEIKKLFDCPSNDINFKKQPGKTYLGKKEYKFNYKAF